MPSISMNLTHRFFTFSFATLFVSSMLFFPYLYNAAAHEENTFLWKKKIVGPTWRNPNPKLWDKNRAPTFGDFLIRDTYKGKSAHVRLGKKPEILLFRSVLRSAAAEQANFAGRYIIANWGCGTSCEVGMMIDAPTGEVYSPKEYIASRGVRYALDSALFIVDPPADDNPFDAIARLDVRYYVWKDHALNLVYQEKCVSKGTQYVCH